MTIGIVQSYYPLEYRTPPLPLVALIGCSEVHKDVADFFVHHLRPPLVSLFTTAEATEQFITRNFGPPKHGTTKAAGSTGIIKGDWLTKHRGKKPAVGLAIVSRHELEGDPSSWTKMLYMLKLVRDAVAQCNAAMVVAVVQGPEAGELPAERVTGVCHNLSLDPRLLVPITPRLPPGADELGRASRDASLRLLGQLIHEQCAVVYSRRAGARAGKLADKQAVEAAKDMMEYSIRAEFKLASFAEFRQDWNTAVQDYQSAYSQLKQAVLATRFETSTSTSTPVPRRQQQSASETASTLPPQRWCELAKAGELLHLKLLMLLMHQNRLDEAAQQAQQHLQLFADPGGSLPAAARCAHLAYLVRQHQVVAEVVCLRTEAALAAGQQLGPAAREISRSMLLLAAAELAIERRKAFHALQQHHPQPPPGMDMSAVRRGPFLGQLVLKSGSGPSAATRPLTDSEYIAYLASEEAGPATAAATAHATATTPRGVPTAVSAALEVLNSALLSLQAAGPGGRRPSTSGSTVGGGTAGGSNNERLRSRLTLMLAGEHVAAGNLSAARKLLLQACHTYRREGWTPPLAVALDLLREAAGKLRNFQEQAIYTLELASIGGMPGGPGPAAACKSILTALAAGAHDATAATAAASSAPHASGPNGHGPGPVPFPREYHYVVEYPVKEARPRPQQQQQQGQQEGEGAADGPQRKHQQDFGWWRCIAIAVGAPKVPPGSETVDLHLAMWSLLPLPQLALSGAFLTVEDEQGEWDAAVSPVASVDELQDLPVASAPAVSEGRDAAVAKDRGGGLLSSVPVRPSGLQPLSLRHGRWERAVAHMAPRCVGRLAVQRITLLLGDHASVTFRVDTFPTGRAGSTSLGGLHSQLGLPAPFTGRGGVQAGGWQLAVTHLGPPPTVRPHVPAVALVGESAPVTLAVENSGRPLEGAIMEFAVKLGAGLSPADLTLVVDDEGRLATLPLDGQGRIRLPLIPAGGSFEVRAWLRCDCVGKLSLTALLMCPLPLAPTIVEMVFEEPFEYRCQLASEAGIHTLTPPFRPAGPLPSSVEAGVTPVTIGQQVLVHTMVRGLQDAQLELCSAKLLANREAGLMPVAELTPQLQGWPVVLGQGDVQALVLPLCPTNTSETGVPLGALQLMWRRRDERSLEAESAPHSRRLRPEEVVTTVLELPKVTVGDSLLTVRSVGPAQVTAGISFTYSLQVQNFSHHAVELMVSLQDSPGFVLSGERTQAFSVGPRDSSTAMWLLIAHVAGHLLLPSARVTAARLNCSLSTQSSHIYVLPF